MEHTQLRDEDWELIINTRESLLRPSQEKDANRYKNIFLIYSQCINYA